MSSIRAYCHQDRFITESERRVDDNQAAYYPSVCAKRYCDAVNAYTAKIKKHDLNNTTLNFCNRKLIYVA